MRISVRRWAASLIALLLVGVVAHPSARADESGNTAWLGVFTQELSPELEDALDHRGDAVLVTRVVSGSPADRAGLRKGDLIVQVESENVSSPAALARLVQRFQVGDEIQIRVVRDGERRTLRAVLGSRAEERGEKKTRIERFERRSERHGQDHERHGDRSTREFRIQVPDPPEAPDAPAAPLLGRARLGVRIENLNSDLAEYFDVPGGRGALVVEVVEGSAAERIGIKPGDVIVRIDGNDVSSSDDVIRGISEASDRVAVTVVRHGSRRTFETELGAAPDSRMLRLRRPGVNTWRFDGNAWRRGATPAPDARSREDMERELRELREELKELKEDLKQLRER